MRPPPFEYMQDLHIKLQEWLKELWLFVHSGSASVVEGTTPMARVYMSADQTIGTTWTPIQFNVESYDFNSDFNTANYRFTAPDTAYYEFHIKVWGMSTAGNMTIYLRIYKNSATTLSQIQYFKPQNQFALVAFSDILKLTASDYVTIDLRTDANNFSIEGDNFDYESSVVIRKL